MCHLQCPSTMRLFFSLCWLTSAWPPSWTQGFSLEVRLSSFVETPYYLWKNNDFGKYTLSDKVLGYFYSLMMKSRSGPLVLLYVITFSHLIHWVNFLFFSYLFSRNIFWTYRLGGIARHNTIQDELGSYICDTNWNGGMNKILWDHRKVYTNMCQIN